jgi:hypothetical protein
MFDSRPRKMLILLVVGYVIGFVNMQPTTDLPFAVGTN